jgi:hypothetical protein
MPRQPHTSIVLVGIGLAILGIAPWWQIAPVVTAMSIITLGATEITLSRYRGTARLPQAAALHASTYAALYVLFVGAALNSASRAASSGFAAWTALDLAASVLPMTLAAKRIFDAPRQPARSK